MSTETARAFNPRVLLVGLGVVAPLVAILVMNLGRDPHVIGSPLVGRPAPDFTLQPMGGGAPVTLASLRGQPVVLNFWATWCAPCASEFPDLETTYRMYRSRNLEFVSVSVNDPAERPAVLAFLQSHHASHPNRLFATSDVYGLQAAFDPQMPAPVPFTLLLAPNGDVVYQELGELTISRLRRAILANLPDDEKYPGQQAYWSNPD